MSLIGIRRLQVSSRPSHRAAVGSVLEWGVRSLDELRDVVDETMADELACMVREKMLRILSDVADFEEVAEEFERTMTQGVAAAAAATDRIKPETSPSADPDDDDDVIPQRLSGESDFLWIPYYSSRSKNEPRRSHTLDPSSSSWCTQTLGTQLLHDDGHLRFLVSSSRHIGAVKLVRQHITPGLSRSPDFLFASSWNRIILLSCIL